jgi:hypothetical protein
VATFNVFELSCAKIDAVDSRGEAIPSKAQPALMARSSTPASVARFARQAQQVSGLRRIRPYWRHAELG